MSYNIEAMMHIAQFIFSALCGFAFTTFIIAIIRPLIMGASPVQENAANHVRRGTEQH